MDFRRFLIVTVIALFSIFPALAEEAAAAPQPTPEHAKLAQWVGSWSGSGDMKPGPFGEGGHMAWTEECSWFGGGKFHVVCKSKGNGPTGSMTGIGIVGYQPGKKVYTHYGVDSNGWSGYSEGTVTGDTWTFNSSETFEGKTYETRFKMKMTSPDEMTFSWEMAPDGENWMVLMEGVSKKK